MLDRTYQAKIIAKIRHFAEYVSEKKGDEECLAITLHECDTKKACKQKILVYQEIIDEYYNLFDEIVEK